MKSKHKDAYIQHKRQKSDPYENHMEIVKRTTGSKPFQLSKVRGNKRTSCEVNQKSPREHTHFRNVTGPDETSEAKDVYLDLIIKKKMLVDNKHNHVLESQRKSLIYEQLEDEIQNLDKIFEREKQSVKIKATKCLNRDEQVPYQAETLHQQKINRKRLKCQCCQQINCYLNQAVIQSKINENGIQEKLLTNQTDEQKHQAVRKDFDLRIQLKNIKDRAQKSPFSFTNMRWRTKSEIFQIDKWKQKYGKDQDNLGKKSNSIAKILTTRSKRQQQKLPSLQKKVKKQKILTQFDRQLFPSLKRNNPINKMTIEDNKKIDQGQLQTELPSPSKINTITPRKERIRIEEDNDEPQILTNVVEPNIVVQEDNIPINDYYSATTTGNTPEPEKKQKKQSHKQKINLQKKDQSKKKHKKEVPKIPFIRGLNVGSQKIVEDSKKKNKFSLTHKISPHTWRQALPKKTFLDKIIEQIPERWQYGESRDNSREVSQYLKVKEEEQKWELQILKEQQQRRIMESQLATYCQQQPLQNPKEALIIQ